MITLRDFLTEASVWDRVTNTAARIKTNVVRRVLPSRVKGALGATGLIGRSLQSDKPDWLKKRLRQKAKDWATKGFNPGNDGNYKQYDK